MIIRFFQERRWSVFSIIGWVITISLSVLLLVSHLNTFPDIFWDEGWTLDAARNWVVNGHLGHYLLGLPVPARIPVRLPIVAIVALSMKVFGIGTWQGRLPEVIFTLFSLGLVVYLATKAFNYRIGVASLILILSLSVYIFHPFIIGRQVMAEMPMMFFLLAGYSFLWLALNHSRYWLIGAAIFFGLAFHAKLQVPPFLFISFLVAIIASIFLRQRRYTLTLVWTALGSLLTAIIIFLLQFKLIPGSFSDPALIKLLFNSVILVLDSHVRIQVFSHILLFGAPLILSYIWIGFRIFQDIRTLKKETPLISAVKINKTIIMIALWGLGFSWLMWYALMSTLYIRYLFPPFFIGCIFIASYIHELTNGFDFRVFVRRIGALILRRNFSFINFQTLFMLIALSINLSAAISSIQIGLSLPRYDPELVAKCMREHIPLGATIETFESELFFIAPEFTYHFPSDLVSMQAQRKTVIDPNLTIEYDPKAINPDYIALGYMGHLWPIYNDFIDNGMSKVCSDIGGYDIYRTHTIIK